MPIIVVRRYKSIKLKGKEMKGLKIMFISVCALLLPLCLGGHVQAPSGQIAHSEDLYKDSVVRLEAIMVEAQASQLHDLGIPTFSQSPKLIEVDKILKCPDAKVAELKAAISLEVGHEERAKTDAIIRQGFYTGRSNPTLEYGDFGPSLVVEAQVLSEMEVFVEVTFKHSSLTEDKPYAEKGRPAIMEKNW